MIPLLLILIFARPFIASQAFPYVNTAYSICLLLFIATWFIKRDIHLKELGNLIYPLALFCLSLIISMIFSQNKYTSLEEAYKYATGVCLFLLAASLSLKDKTRLMHAIVSSGLIISILAIYQYFFGFQHLSEYVAKMNISDSFIVDYVSRKRVFCPFTSPNLLGGFLSMIIPLALINKKIIWLSILMFAALLLTQSLGALISLFFGLIVYFYLNLKGRIGKRNVIIIFGLLLIIGVVFIMRSSAQKEYFQPMFSVATRLGYWKDALEIIKQSPWVGIGLGNFDLPQTRYAHNSYLQIWAEMGIIGILAFLWLAIAIIKRGLANINKPALNNPEIIGLLTASLIFLIHDFMYFSFFFPEVAFIWWIIAGMALNQRYNPTNNG